jgi:outer membrane protein assembly factor BamB
MTFKSQRPTWAWPQIRLGTLAGCVLSIAAATSHAEDWPQWRGPNTDGIYPAAQAQTKWTKTDNVLWRTPLPGQGGATPVIFNGRIYLTSADGDDLVLLCIQAKDGQEIWKRKVASGNQDARAGEGNSASPSPSTDGKHVWVFFSTGVLACFDVDGQEQWTFDVGERFGKLDIQFGMTSTPVLDGDHLYLQLIHGPMSRADSSQTGKVIKLDKRTGKTVWEHDRMTEVDFECKHSYASPFIYDDGSRRFLVVHGADCTTGHDLANGKELWRLSQLNGPTALNKKDHDPTFRFVASPAVTKGWIIVPTAKGGPMLGLRVNDKLKGSAVAESSQIQWSVGSTPDVCIPLVADGLVYALQNDGRLQCLELDSGKEVYFERTHSSQHRASPVLAGGYLFLCARDGMVTVVKAGRNFEIVSKNNMDEPMTASPVFADGVMYLRTYDALYAIR